MKSGLPPRMSRLRIRDLALFVLVAAGVAVAAPFAAREAGLGDRSAAPERDPLILTVAHEPGFCTTKEARGITRAGERQPSSWVVTQETTVQWRVDGGEPPYMIEIDGRSADSTGAAFTGETGTATITCANTSASYRWGYWSGMPTRYYTSDPDLDSGWKTVKAKVRDANGDTAEAKAQFYVAFQAVDDLHLLRRGETYLVFGHLITIPDGVDMRIGGAITGSGGGGGADLLHRGH